MAVVVLSFLFVFFNKNFNIIFYHPVHIIITRLFLQKSMLFIRLLVEGIFFFAFFFVFLSKSSAHACGRRQAVVDWGEVEWWLRSLKSR